MSSYLPQPASPRWNMKSLVYGCMVLFVMWLIWGRTSIPHQHHGSSMNRVRFDSQSIPDTPQSVGTSGLWIYLVLDESGSMAPVQRDTIKAFNDYIQEQHSKSSGTAKTYASLMKFEGGHTSIVYDKQLLNQVPQLTTYSYRPAGSTNLYDAVGMTIANIDSSLARTPSIFDRPAVLVVILTDGEENSSRSFSGNRIQHMIKQRRDVGWQFIFLGANIEAGDVAESIGIPRASAIKVDVAKASSYGAALNSITDAYRDKAHTIQTMASSYARQADGENMAATMMDSMSDMEIDQHVRDQYEVKGS